MGKGKKKKLGGKKKIPKGKGRKKKGKGKRKAGKKGKKKTTQPKTVLEIKLTEQMMKRIHKKPRPMKTLQEKYKKMVEWYAKKRKRGPVYPASRFKTKAPEVPSSTPLGTNRSTNASIGELGSVFQIRRITMIEKRKGEEDDSPINIMTNMVRKCNYQRLTFEGLFDPERKTVITNSGYHVIGHLGGDVLISNGPLFGKYKLENFHVHYGECHNDGTEHAIDDKRYTMELHMVFLPYSDEFSFTEETINMKAKKAVVGLMFKLSTQPSYYDLFAVVTHISEKGKSLETSNNLLYDFKDVLSGSEYYNYSGSGTEGDHKEYEWLLFKKVLPINKSQMQNMWDLRKFDTEKSNVKPIQPLGERSIFSPFYYDHQMCRGKESCKCFGHSKAFKPVAELKPIPFIE